MTNIEDWLNETDLSEKKEELLALLLEEEGFHVSQTQKIKPRKNRQTSQLSFAQQRLWFLDQMYPGDVSYNIPSVIRLTGALDRGALERSLDALISRHEVLRTAFKVADGNPYQEIAPPFKVHLPLIDCQATPEAERHRETWRIAYREAEEHFDLAQLPLLRAALLRFDKDDHALLITMHHIISDGWSLGIIFRDLAALYQAFSRGQAPTLKELPIQYADFAEWQREALHGDLLETQLSYWRTKLEGAEALELPADQQRSESRRLRGATHPFALSKQLSAALKELSKREDATLFMSLLTAFKILLHRYTGQTDIVVGTPVGNRDQVEAEQLIGFFVNTLLLRTDLSGNPTFRELLRRVSVTSVEAYAHQAVPFEMIIQDLDLERELDHNPLLQSMFSLNNETSTDITVAGLTFSYPEVSSATARLNLALSLSDTEQGLTGLLEYNTDLFEAETIERLLSHFQLLLESIANNPDQRISELALLSPEEQHRLLVEFNNTESDYPRAATIQQLFEQQAELHPHAVAVISGDQQLTYAELNERANKLAHYLLAQGVRTETVVAVLMERSIELIVSLLGIVKAGAAYLPLDIAYPEQRLSFILGDASAHLLLTQSQLLPRVPPEPSLPRLCLDTDGNELDSYSTANPQTEINADNLCYLIYTSGSTGQPKGVSVVHRAVVRLVRETNYIKITPADRIAAAANPAFDASTFEVWGALLNGAQVCLISKDVALSPTDFIHELEAQQVSVLFLTTALFNQIARAEAGGLQRLRQLMFGGEKVEVRWVREVMERGKPQHMQHVYGPTESTTFASWEEITEVGDGADLTEGGERGEIEEAGTIPIGRGLSNTQLYVLDEWQRVVPVGVRGELYIGGDGLARGYLNRAELTAEKFVPHPFSSSAGARLYRTGDVVRWTRGGKLEFIGRRDEQVKIRGFRIELGEIESALSSHPAIRECAVIVREDVPGDKRLVAYLVAEGAQVINGNELRSYLQEGLPDYMIPAAFVRLDSLPLTPNGKIDRRALPAPDETSLTTSEFEAPHTVVEEILAGIWSKLLGVERVGVNDNFFELGGHSLLATQMNLSIREAFQVELPLRTLFEHPTVASLGAEIEKAMLSSQGLIVPPLTPANRDSALPLSFAQQRLWFLDQLEPGKPIYNMPSAVRLSGRLHRDALQQTLEEIIRRHEVLRTTFVNIDGEPRQVIAPQTPFSLNFIDLGEHPAATRRAQAERIAAEEAAIPFDLTQGPLLRATLLRLNENEHVLLLTMHHIVSDGWSMGILIRELTALYESFSAGQPSPLDELPIQYADFAQWQRDWLQGAALDNQLSYWKEQLTGVEVLELPTDKPRPLSQSASGASRNLQLSHALTEGLKELSRREGVTLFMTLLAAFQVLLSRYTGQEDIAVGTPIANRNRKEIEGLIGFFVNTLVMRGRVKGGNTFKELLGEIREVSLGAYTHQDVPFEKLVEELQPERSLSHNPLFQVMFALQNAPLGEAALTGINLSPMDVGSNTTRFDLEMHLVESAGGISAHLIYSTDLFEAETIKGMLSHFELLLEDIIAAPDKRIAELEMLSAEEQHRLLIEFNNTASEYPRTTTIAQLFEQQADLHPHAVAVVSGQEQLTYAELNERANRLAHYLLAQGVGTETVVAVLMERSVELIVSLLGIVKAGAAYLPLDMAYPQKRLSFMVQDSEAALLLTLDHLRSAVSEVGIETLYLDTGLNELDSYSTANPQTEINADNLCYLIYTSGSTGQPKGVSVVHRAVVRLVRETNYIEITPADRIAAAANPAFDASTFEIWGALLNGATLVVFPAATLSLHELADVLTEQRVSILWLTAGLFHQMVDQHLAALRQVSHVLAGGDVLSPLHVTQYLSHAPEQHGEAARRAAQDGWALINGYGPTEGTTFSSCHVMREGEEIRGSVPIGQAISNTQLYVLDEWQRVVPVGVRGELYIGGDGLARGYLNRAELTAEKFVPHPFSSSAGARLYRTGDVVRWTKEGKLEFIRRRDEQVKIRGFRIELGEIEGVLKLHPSVKESVVVVREDVPGNKRLVAYVVSDIEKLMPSQLRNVLQQALPDYMIPAAFIQLDALPLTANGKVDRRALPAPDEATLSMSEFVEPRTPVEELLAGIWMEVLGIRQVSINDNFFDLGGHSLLATQVISRVRKLFSVELRLQSLFEAPTIAGMAEIIEKEKRAEVAADAEPLLKVSREGDLPLSFAQQRLWFLDQLKPDNPAYNIPFFMRLRGDFNASAFEQSFQEIIRRHESLRTTFISIDGEPKQVIADESHFNLQIISLEAFPIEIQQSEAERLARAEALRPFNLSQGPLLRATLLRLDENDHVLLLTMHHIVSDGWSMGILIRELTALYESFSAGQPSPLDELPIQYADFAQWQRDWLQGAALDNQLSYWKEQLTGVEVLELPTDKPRPLVQSARGASRSLNLSNLLVEQLKELSRREGVTLFMTLLAAFQILLSRYTGQEDIAVGTPIANRNRKEIEGLIGFFVNTLVLRSDLSGDPTFRDFLRRVRQVCLGAYMHQDLPFEKLVEELQPERSLSHNPLFQVMFNMLNMRDDPFGAPGPTDDSSASTLEFSSKFDLTLYVREHPNGAQLDLVYNTDLFEQVRMEEMLRYFRTLLEDAVATPDQPLSSLQLLTHSEREQLLRVWNETDRDYELEVCLHEHFERQAEATPEAVAAVFEGQVLSYRDLNRRANCLAHHLRKLGVGPDVLVGVCAERSLEMVIGLLGILKAGGAYVPLDPEYPQDRLAFMMADAKPHLLLTQQHLAESFPDIPTRIICLDSDWQEISREDETNPSHSARPENLAYVIYTSGSTGRPKGAMNTHRGICNRLLWMQETYGLLPSDRVLQKTNFSFDVSVWEFFWPLMTGAALVLARPGGHRDSAYLMKFIEQERITTLHFVPSMLQIFLEEQAVEAPAHLRRVICSGEALSFPLQEKFFEHIPAELHNLYGPTEAAVDVTFWQCQRGAGHSSVPIGRPIANTQIYLLDKYGHPVPAGVPGELHIAGIGLARGYRDRAGLTAEKFIPNPFAAVPGERMYATGDVARYRSDGILEFLGRTDYQVKVRGFRIELGEIESALMSHQAVREAVVLAHAGTGGDQRLTAYVVAESGQEPPSPDDLRSLLKKQLPKYMVPSAIVMLGALPLTPNGKVDRRALPAPDEVARFASQAFVAPRDELESQLVQIWEEVLDHRPVGVTDNFFELGGHSLLAARLVARIKKHFDRELPVSILFHGSTIEHLAEYLRQQDEDALQQPTSPLVALQPGGVRPPFFCVHPSTGGVLCYYELSRHLGNDQPFYGLQYTADADAASSPASLEEMAAGYLQAIREVQPVGPYRLGGWSLGGIIAFEMAQQLQKSGERVDLLALIDSVSPLLQRMEIDDDAMLITQAAEALGLSATQLELLEMDERWEQVMDAVKREQGLSIEIAPVEVRRELVRFRTLSGMVQRYAPQPYPGPITLLRAADKKLESLDKLSPARRDSYLSIFDDPTAGWAALSSEPVQSQTVPGDHYSMVNEPHVRVLAERLRNLLLSSSGDSQ